MISSSPSSPGSIGEVTSECILSLRQLGAKLRNGEMTTSTAKETTEFKHSIVANRQRLEASASRTWIDAETVMDPLANQTECEGLAKTRNKEIVDAVGDFSDRLSLWSQDVGAASGRLEGLLAQSSSLRIHTLNLLVDLRAQISDLVSIENEDAIEEIIDIIGSLFHLEPALIDPAPLDRCSSTRESFGLTEKKASVGRKPSSHSHAKLTLVEERRRATSKKPDVDIIAVSGLFGLSSWLPDGHLDDGELTHTWLATLLPDILEENGIYARILSFRCKFPRFAYKEPDFIESQANQLVKQVSTERILDPARPLFFLSHSFGGIFAKQAICTLIDEGLSVNTATPVCGCLFFSVPHDTSGGVDSALDSWILSLLESSDMLQQRRCGPTLNIENRFAQNELAQNELARYILRRMAIRVNETYKEKEIQYSILAINYYEPCCDVFIPPSVATELLPEKMNASADHSGVARFSRDQREYILPAVHRIARIIENASAEWQNEIEHFSALVKQQADLKKQREDPFAMLAGYNTSVLINDCLEMEGQKWSAVVDLVRDLVDVITAYDTEDVDIQFSNQAIQSFSVKDGMQASKLLSKVRPAGDGWDFESQLYRYIVKYLNSKSSRLANGNLRPVNMILLTTGAWPPSDSFDMALKRIADRSKADSVLDLRMQFVQVEQSSSLSEPFSSDSGVGFFQRSNGSQTIMPNIAPVHTVRVPYVSDAAICQRILLGAITNRFHEVPTLSEDGEIAATDTETTSVSNFTGSGAGAGHRKPVGRAFSYASSMTSGDIHLMDEAENTTRQTEEEQSDLPIYNKVQILPRGTEGSIFSRRLILSPSRSASAEISPTQRRASSSSEKRSATPSATFQCSWCSRKFFRAYNLQSHLRTHTDERRYSCSVCNKMFARLHDFKRHESSHSGAKKLVCRGELPGKAGQTWGCGRLFARADALGRHFRSEAGQMCIKPLLDEEEAVRQRQARKSDTHRPTVSSDWRASNLPAALITQYPALAAIDWTAIEPEKIDYDPGELSDINPDHHSSIEDAQ